ncbi:lipid asymmetry maintenance protein MlaB [Acidithiobacillus sp. IBUN Pt1247-S3]|uniref:STAS domain-containing protein n=1 Tax=Acidithiobacillus sp. IBUN Pt1247-S3 TaxID=3166642 RepID=UPI0034E57B46
MDLHETRNGDSLRISLDGALDIYAVTTVLAQIRPLLASNHQVELDLRGVEELDGAGLQLLMALKSGALALGCKLGISGHSSAVIQALELCRLLPFFGDPVLLSQEGKR